MSLGYRIGNFGFSGGSALLAIAGGNTVSVGSTLAKVSVGLLGILFAHIDLHGKPNSFVEQGGSFGEYDENGNLKYRTDTDHFHYIKELQEAYKPHTHHFKWRIVKGIWRYVERVLP